MNKISIIIPVYNSEKNLRGCLNSVLHQTYNDIEIVLINDGSTDKSKDICKEYAKNDKRIIFINQENRGPAETRNRGLKVATGEYITFVDSDDYINEKMYEKMISRIIKDNSDIAICQHTEIINKRKIHMNYRYLSPIIENDEIIKLFLKGNTVNAYLWNKLYRKELFNKLEFSNLRMLEDFDIMYKLLKKCNKISFINEELYYYRCDDDNSLSKKCCQKMVGDYLYALSEMYKELENNYLLKKEICFNKVIMYIPLFSYISQADYYYNNDKFNNIYLDYKNSFKYIVLHGMIKELNLKQLIKGNLLYFNKKYFNKIYRKKLKK